MRIALIAAAAAAFSTSAFAQDPGGSALPSPEEVRSTNGFTIGAGVGVVPDYEGSDDYRLIPAAAIRGKVGHVSFTTRGLYLYVDVVDSGLGKLDFDVGPIAGVRLNRTGRIKDDVVDLLPDRNTAVELGGFAGVSLHGVTNPYDALSARLDVVKDVANAHESTIFTPNLEFSTPLSRTTFVGLSASADFVSNRFADYYFGITPADTLASGLRTYNPRGGMKSWKLGLLVDQSLSGDLLHGVSLFGLASYSRLVGDFKDSPIVDDRGSASQWFGGIGVGYSW